MKCSIVVEGPSDEVIIRALLSPHVPDRAYSVLVAGGFSPALSLARTLLLRGASCIAMVVDSDSLEEGMIERRRQIAERFLAPNRGTAEERVFVAVPEIEAWLCSDIAVLERIVGHKISPTLATQIRRHPKQLISHYVKKSEKLTADIALRNRLANVDLSSIGDREGPVRDLIEFVGRAGTQKARNQNGGMTHVA